MFVFLRIYYIYKSYITNYRPESFRPKIYFSRLEQGRSETPSQYSSNGKASRGQLQSSEIHNRLSSKSDGKSGSQQDDFAEPSSCIRPELNMVRKRDNVLVRYRPHQHVHPVSAATP